MTGWKQKPKGEDVAERPCMKCRKPFESEWIGNRLCPLCKEHNGIEVIADNAYGGRVRPNGVV